ncbi:Protein of unknown function (DUF1262 [Striga hermonthica]|uniref:Uncharacterized protein n=1 Tax=Striga hermonthica TaxID=68872 RepID=A0A9N7RK66_STRHE|nr:Protein of unknown function (DUF1262 [Striga hermonthica]
MYTTRTLSQLKQHPELLGDPPEGPNSDYLVIEGEQYTEDTVPSCFGMCFVEAKLELPLPQDKRVIVEYKVSPDGQPPRFLRGGEFGWRIVPNPYHFHLRPAGGLDPKLFDRLPSFDFPLSKSCSTPMAIGRWYCPFLFVKEGNLGNRVIRLSYYGMTLERRWKKVFTCRDSNDARVAVSGLFENEVSCVGKWRAKWDEKKVDCERMIWYESCGGRVSLRREIVEWMRWEDERRGWVSGDEERQMRVERVDKFKGSGVWTELGCYVLVARFSLKAIGEELVMWCEYRHFDKMKVKWDKL